MRRRHVLDALQPDDRVRLRFGRQARVRGGVLTVGPGEGVFSVPFEMFLPAMPRAENLVRHVGPDAGVVLHLDLDDAADQRRRCCSTAYGLVAVPADMASGAPPNGPAAFRADVGAVAVAIPGSPVCRWPGRTAGSAGSPGCSSAAGRRAARRRSRSPGGPADQVDRLRAVRDQRQIETLARRSGRCECSRCRSPIDRLVQVGSFCTACR